MNENKLKTTTTTRFFLCAILVIIVTGGVSAQVSDLSVNSTDIRFEAVVLNGAVVGYNLFVRKKPEMESVMLTEKNGNYALRSMEWNAVNGNERRELSRVAINDVNSRFSILSSTPIPDMYFGVAFRLFMPPEIVYGNPSSPAGAVVMNIKPGFRINIRTFDHKYADPTIGRYQNNQFMVSDASVYEDYQYTESITAPEPQIRSGSDSRLAALIQLKEILIDVVGIDKEILKSIGDEFALGDYLWNVFYRGR